MFPMSLLKRYLAFVKILRASRVWSIFQFSPIDNGSIALSVLKIETVCICGIRRAAEQRIRE